MGHKYVQHPPPPLYIRCLTPQGGRVYDFLSAHVTAFTTVICAKENARATCNDCAGVVYVTLEGVSR